MNCRDMEFIEILPFTPANRNNLIGWIAGRSDDAHYGTSVVYDFPKAEGGCAEDRLLAIRFSLDVQAFFKQFARCGEAGTACGR